MKIFKYKLEVTDEQVIYMPKGALILSCQFQNNDLCLWAIVNPETPAELRRFEIVGTGHDIELKERQFIATVQNSEFVWHVFEIYPKQITNLPLTQ